MLSSGPQGRFDSSRDRKVPETIPRYPKAPKGRHNVLVTMEANADVSCVIYTTKQGDGTPAVPQLSTSLLSLVLQTVLRSPQDEAGRCKPNPPEVGKPLVNYFITLFLPL